MKRDDNKFLKMGRNLFGFLPYRKSSFPRNDPWSCQVGLLHSVSSQDHGKQGFLFKKSLFGINTSQVFVALRAPSRSKRSHSKPGNSWPRLFEHLVFLKM